MPTFKILKIKYLSIYKTDTYMVITTYLVNGHLIENIRTFYYTDDQTCNQILLIFYWRTRMLGIFSKCKDVKAIMAFETMVFIAFLTAVFAVGIAIF